MVLVLVLAAWSSAAYAAHGTAGIANTGAGADPEKGFGWVAGAPILDDLIALPFNPSQPQPTPLLSPGTPEDDLAAELEALADAGDVAAATAARQRAIDILEGNPIAGKAYSGIPLLNYYDPAKVKSVPTTGPVVVNQVRWGEHVISDTAQLQFAPEARDQGYSITYRIAELGSAAGGQLTPTPLLEGAEGAPVGGQHSAIQPLSIANRPTGTTQLNRFLTDRGLGAAAEQTRASFQEVTVRMPPPNRTRVVLDPAFRPGHRAAGALVEADRAEAERQAAGRTLPATRTEAIAELAGQAPERLIWSALTNLDPAAPGFLEEARGKGAGNRGLIGAMRARTALPSGLGPELDPAADVTVVIQNNETYLDRRALRLPAGRTLTVRVINRDGFAHRLTAFDLNERTRSFGAEDWGEFHWAELPLDGATLGAGESRTFTLTPSADSFAVWIGDLGSGDQAQAYVELDRAANKQEQLRFGAGTMPVHATPDAVGNVWVTLAGVDTIARIRPQERLADSPVDRFPLPGGRLEVDSAVPPLAPQDVTVDGRGIVWASLGSANAIARIDPALVRDGTSAGITVLRLDPCPTTVERCRPEVPPVPNEPPTRRPTRIRSLTDGQGNTVLWFVEAGASAIGVLRVTPDGRPLDQAHFDCACLEPESVDLGPDGSVWFAQIFENRIGRIRPAPNRPYSDSAARIDHYDIPGAAEVFDAAVPGGRVMTSLPLSLAVDGRNRVWFSQSALSGIAWLDPDRVVSNPSRERPATVPTEGFTEISQPGSDFRSPAAPADVTVDKANNFWWAGEYGDQIEQVTAGGDTGLRFRGSARRGLTEGPVVDTKGNLWVVETGGNLITRISGVTDGPLRPFGSPPGYEADTAQNTVSGMRVPDATSVAVRVERGGTLVARGSSAVQDGRFSIARWDGATDPIQPDDVVILGLEGPFERAPLSFRVAELTAAAQPDGSLAGRATAAGLALADRIDITYQGGSASAAIEGADGSWRHQPASAPPPSSQGTVSWSGATVAGTFRTVNRFVTPPAPPGAPPPTAAPPAPAAPAPPAGGPGADDGSSGDPPSSPRTARDAACEERQWLYGRRQTAVLLLGMKASEVTRCLGDPDRRIRASGGRPERWRYGRGLEVALRRSRVVGFTLGDGRFGTSRNGAGVGTSVRALRSSIRGLQRDPRGSGQYRAIIRQSSGAYADVRALVGRAGKVRRIDVTLKTRRQLDRFGRALARRSS